MTAYYMPQMVCPWIATQKGRLFGLGDEAVQCNLFPDGWVLQQKNELSEEFCITPTAIQRGADTSSLWTPDGKYQGFFYIQYTRNADGTLTYGCNWSPLWMSVGETYVRNAYIVEYWWDGRIKAQYPATTALKFEQFHASYTFARSGITVANVAELSWEGEERYFYAANYGLVGWLNARTGAGSYLGSVKDVYIRPPVSHPIPRPAVPPPQKEYPVTPLPGWADHNWGTPVPNAIAKTSANINIRPLPSATAQPIRGVLKNDMAVTYWDKPYNDGTYSWTKLRLTDGVEGYVANVGGLSFVVPPAPPAVKGRYLSPEAEARIRAYSKAIDDANAGIMAELDAAPEVAPPDLAIPF